MTGDQIIVGIDPGLSSGGLVAVTGRSERIVRAYSLVGPGVPTRASRSLAEPRLGDRNFTLAVRLAAAQAAKVAAIIGELRQLHRILAIGIESFVDQRSRAREERNRLLKDRWKTPLVIGHMGAALAAAGFSEEHGNLFYQEASVVLRQFSDQLAALAARARGERDEPVCPNDHLLTNDHMRTAWAHAVWLSHRAGKDLP